MKHPNDKYTVDAFNKPKRGRPCSPLAKSNAQRQREFRLRKKAGESSVITVTRNGN
jgi:hypothetical protein